MDEFAPSVSKGSVQASAAAGARPDPGDSKVLIPEERRYRIVIENVSPEIDCGEFPIKLTTGEVVVVEADVLVEGHDALSCVLLYRKEGEPGRRELPMEALRNGRWRASFTVTELGQYSYTLMGWVDRFGAWARDLWLGLEAGQDVKVELMIGAGLVAEASHRAARSEKGGRPSTAAERKGGRRLTPRPCAPATAKLSRRPSRMTWPA